MKLRNKKTGEIVEREEFILIKHIKGDGGWQDGSYHSLAELNEEWEDYKPKEPLIKDEKIRKAVRAWANINRSIYIMSSGNYTANDNRGLMIEFNKSWTTCMENGKQYTIAELCGEKEE